MPNHTTGVVISPNQSQYDMVRGRGGVFADIIISSSNQTTQGDIYIIPFISNNYYWSGSNRSINNGTWRFDLGDVDRADMILIDYPLGDLSSDQIWDVSKIFEAARCLWIDGYYEGDPLVSNGYNFGTLFSNGFTSFGNHPDSIELAWITGADRDPIIESSQFGLIDLSKIDLNTINSLTASQFQSTYGHLITSRALVIANPIITGPSGIANDLTSDISIEENTTAIHTFTANQPVIWSVSGGTDISKFTINSSTGELSFISAPDYEIPTDSDSNNIYQVVVTGTDSARNISTQELTININNIFETTTTSSLSDLEALQYIASNPDLIASFGIDTIAASSHYTNYGISEGRSLTVFSASLYLAKYSDLSDAFGNEETLALKHYIQSGYSEGRTDSSSGSSSASDSSSSSSSDSSSTSDSSSSTSSTEALSDLEALQYIASNPDLIASFGIDKIAASSHYTSFGISEGRSLTIFSASLYLAKYSDLAAAFGNDETLALQHYIQSGYAEGRTDSSSGSSSGSSSSSDSSSSSTTSSPTALSDFEALNYVASHSDLMGVFGIDTSAASSHYVNSGYAEGRAKDDFDEWGYLASNNDLMTVLGSNTTEAIKHYISFGKSEGRSTNIFNADSYLNNYADLKNDFGNDKELATKHYVENGFNEGRVF